MNAMNRVVLCTLAVLSLLATALAQPGSAAAGGYTIQETRLWPLDVDALTLSLEVSGDGRHLAYVAAKGRKSWVVVDGQAGAEYEAIESLKVSPDSKRVAYVVEKKGPDGRHRGELVVVDEQTGREYDRVDGPIFSPDSNAWRIGL